VTFARRLLLSAALLTALAGCGGPARASAGPSAVDWAAQVCTTLGPWRMAIVQLNHDAQARLAAATTPGQTRTELLTLFTGGQDATERARAAIVAAGVPDVAGGAELAQRFVASLAQVRDAYTHAATSLRAIPTAAASYYDQVAAVITTLTQEYDHSAVDLSTLSSPQLRAAFLAQDKCQ
jgi:hypothetical protein